MRRLGGIPRCHTRRIQSEGNDRGGQTASALTVLHQLPLARQVGFDDVGNRRVIHRHTGLKIPRVQGVHIDQIESGTVWRYLDIELPAATATAAQTGRAAAVRVQRQNVERVGARATVAAPGGVKSLVYIRPNAATVEAERDHRSSDSAAGHAIDRRLPRSGQVRQSDVSRGRLTNRKAFHKVPWITAGNVHEIELGAIWAYLNREGPAASTPAT